MDVYRQPSAMEPLLPKGQSVRLSELTCEILKASGRLTGQVHSPLVLQQVADCKRRLKSAPGGARKVLHLPGKEDCFLRVSSSG